MSETRLGKVLLAAGGTGGHMFPAESLARELGRRGIAVVLITDRRGGGFTGELAALETHRVRAGGIVGGGVLKRLRGVIELGIGVLQARRLVARMGADAVVGFGGYASVAAVLAGSRAGLRVVLHEQNAFAGRANRLLAGRADAIATSFTRVGGLDFVDPGKLRLTGNPVRDEIAVLGERPYAAPKADEEIHILVLGGSLGARAFNDLVPAAVARLPDDLRRRLRISQQVRGEGLPAVEAAYEACGLQAELAGFFDDVPARLTRASLVICRAGASTVAELAAAGRPAILVPWPQAADDHQTANARALEAAGGAWTLPQPELTAARLAALLESLLGDPERLAAAAGKAAGFAPRDAARRLADLVQASANDNGGAEPLRDPREAA